MISTSSGGASRRMGGRAVDGSRRRFALRVRAASSARAGHAAPSRTAPMDKATTPWRIHAAVHRALAFTTLSSTDPRSCRATRFEPISPSLTEFSGFDSERARVHQGHDDVYQEQGQSHLADLYLCGWPVPD